MSALTEEAGASEPGYVLCVGLSLAQVREVTAALQSAVPVLATNDTAGARTLLVPAEAAGIADVAADDAEPVGAVQTGAVRPGPRPAPPPRHLATNVVLTPRTAAPSSDRVSAAAGAAAGSRGAPAPAPVGRGRRWPAYRPGSRSAAPAPAPGSGAIPVVPPTTSIPVVPPPVVPAAQLAQTVVALDRGPLHVDLSTREVTARGIRIHLSRREFDLLVALAFDAGRVWSFEELTHLVWRTGFLGDTDPVASAVKRLRKRLLAVPGLEVASVRGVGYRLLVPA